MPAAAAGGPLGAERAEPSKWRSAPGVSARWWVIRPLWSFLSRGGDEVATASCGCLDPIRPARAVALIGRVGEGPTSAPPAGRLRGTTLRPCRRRLTDRMALAQVPRQPPGRGA